MQTSSDPQTQDGTKDSPAAGEAPAADSAWAESARAALHDVQELLGGTRANPADRTCLAVRHSLVKAREEELAGKLRDMEVLRQGGALPPGGSQLQAELQQAQARLQEHGQYIDGKLLALSKYCARLDAALAWAADLAQRRAAGAPAADIAAALAERSHEVREVLENYTNLERQCGAARQTVAPDVREPALRLRELWQTLRAPPTAAPPTTAPSAAAPPAASPPERRSSSYICAYCGKPAALSHLHASAASISFCHASAKVVQSSSRSHCSSLIIVDISATNDIKT